MRNVFATAIVIVLAIPVIANHHAPPSGFTALFNGSDLAGWWGAGTEKPEKLAELAGDKRSSLADIRKHWTVKDGVLINDGEGLYLSTDENYGDFELLLEYKTVPKADSGIYLRGMPQVQIWDHTNPAQFKFGNQKGSGGLWNNSEGAPGKDPLTLADKPFGEWNRFRIVMVGERVSVWLNDLLVVNHARMENMFDRAKPVPRTGPIQLQTHGGEIRWRNIFIRQIGSEEANTILRRHAGGGFTALFNGKDLSGWTGAVASYEVTDGAIVCKPGEGGDLLTSDEYGDFSAEVEFKLPPAGNNGLAIRHPGGKASGAYEGMCELQVLDSDHPAYKGRIDPRQVHGSAYAMVGAHRGYLRPTGRWNYQFVTVQGSTIRVELNGTRILDCDLSTVTEFMKDTPHPGKDRTSGYFGLMGHNDPVPFRAIRIKRLN